MYSRFGLSSQECEILLEFERAPSLQALADQLHKDISVVSRNLKSISEKSDVLEKRNGRWALTHKGLALNKWTEEAIFSQNLTLSRQKSLKIATTREFASRILVPQTRALIGDDNLTVSLVSSDDGIESLLLAGEADFGFDCGRPQSPLIAFKRVARESFALVASPQFIKKNKVKTFEDVREHQHLKFTRSKSSILDLDVDANHYYGTFSDISTMREACKLSYGWAILPYYTVVTEIQTGKLKTIPGLKIEDAKFGVWWLRERKTLLPWIKRATQWLKSQESKLLLKK